MTVMAPIWIPPSTMNTAAGSRNAWIVINTEARSQSENALRLMPAEQCSRIRWRIWGR
jgi:hypothetical protein